MRRGNDASVEQSDLKPALRVRLREDAGMLIKIGKGRISHFNGFFNNPPAGIVREALRVVDGLGYRIAGKAELARDLLDGYSFDDRRPPSVCSH